MNQNLDELIFLKLGGSLITDKHSQSTARIERVHKLAVEIAEVQADSPNLKLLLGHGSGSFGHVAASIYSTRQGVSTPQEWRGFAEVWHQANLLNRIMIDALHKAGLPAVTFSAASSAVVRDGILQTWNLDPMRKALAEGLLPVVHGDVAFDQTLGGTILSTEDIFQYLAHALQPKRILLAGIEPGVWADYPACTRIIPEITPTNQAEILPLVGASEATDVTGGMASKVRQMLDLTADVPGLEVMIFSATKPGELKTTISSIDSSQPSSGTLIRQSI